MTRWSLRHWVAASTATLILAGAVAWTFSPWGPDRSPAEAIGTVALATGPTGGVSNDYGLALTEVVGPRGQLRTLVTDGSRENLDRLLDGSAAFALATVDVVEQYLADEPEAASIRAVARLYDSYVQLVVRAGPDVAVHRLADLRGLKVSVGGRGSGNALAADRVLAAAGIDPSTGITRLELGRAEAVAALQSGRIDAFFVLEGLPSPDLTRVSAESSTGAPAEVRFLDLADVAGDLVGSPGCPAATCAVYHSGTVPAGTYPNLAVSITTVAVSTLLLTTTAVGDDVVRNLTGLLFDSARMIATTVPAVSQIDRHAAIFTGAVPLHAGARAYYRSTKIAALSPVLAPPGRPT